MSYVGFQPLKMSLLSFKELLADMYMYIIIRFYIQTWFIGKCGRDTGGVTRELWRLFGYCLVELCEGTPNCLVFRHDSGRVSVRFRE